MAGTKRASPGADNQKNPLHDVEITDEAASKLGEVAKEIQRAELVQGTSNVFAAFPYRVLTMSFTQSATRPRE